MKNIHKTHLCEQGRINYVKTQGCRKKFVYNMP